MNDKQVPFGNKNRLKGAQGQYKTGTTCAGLGFLLTMVGHSLYSLQGYFIYLAIVMILIGIPIFFIGCFLMSKGKGYHGAWALLGLLSLIGLIILFLLPKRNEKIPYY